MTILLTFKSAVIISAILKEQLDGVCDCCRLFSEVLGSLRFLASKLQTHYEAKTQNGIPREAFRRIFDHYLAK